VKWLIPEYANYVGPLDIFGKKNWTVQCSFEDPLKIYVMLIYLHLFGNLQHLSPSFIILCCSMDPGFHAGQLMRGHSNFVSAVCVMPPDAAYEQGLLVTGSNDNTILGYTPNSAEPVFKLTGHEGTGITLLFYILCWDIFFSFLASFSDILWQNMSMRTHEQPTYVPYSDFISQMWTYEEL
jgi:WD40 repeat protein